MVTVCWTGVVPLMVKGAGTLQVMPVGTGDVGGVQVRVIVVEVPRTGVKFSMIAAGVPAETVFMVVVLPFGSPTVKSGAWPVPVREAMRVAGALPVVVTVRVPVRVPAVVGVKVMAMAQEPFAAMLVPQVLVWVKSPVGTIDATVVATAAWLVTVMVCEVELSPSVVAEKVRVEGERVGAAGA